MMWSTSALLGCWPCSQLRVVLHSGQVVRWRSVWRRRVVMFFHRVVPVREVAMSFSHPLWLCQDRCPDGYEAPGDE